MKNIDLTYYHEPWESSLACLIGDPVFKIDPPEHLPPSAIHLVSENDNEINYDIYAKIAKVTGSNITTEFSMSPYAGVHFLKLGPFPSDMEILGFESETASITYSLEDIEGNEKYVCLRMTVADMCCSTFYCSYHFVDFPIDLKLLKGN